MIDQVRNRLDILKVAVAKEREEIFSLRREFDEDKRFLYAEMKLIERMLVQLLHNTTGMLTNNLQKKDNELEHLEDKINDKLLECNKSEKIWNDLIELNSKKDYWQIYQYQSRLKKDLNAKKGVMYILADIRKEAIKSVSNKSISKKTMTDGVVQAAQPIPPELIARKEELKKLICMTDYSYMIDIGKEIQKTLKIIVQRVQSRIADLKQNMNLVTIKNNPDPIIKKNDKPFIAKWILNGRTGKTIELELLYKGKRDGFKASEFHSRCDTRYPTITFISAGTQVFGGYTTVPWSSPSPGIFKEDSNAFTFSVTKQAKCSIMSDKRSAAVRHLEGVGPTFGSTDIYIGNDCDKNEASYAVGNICYLTPVTPVSGMMTTTVANTSAFGAEGKEQLPFYCDTRNFRVIDIEVYRVKIS
jgi:hypothetical protein